MFTVLLTFNTDSDFTVHRLMVTQKSKGFSLLEVMVVVAILGVVAGIAVPIYNGYTASARATECANEVAALRLAEEEFFLVNNTYFAGATAAALQLASTGVYLATPTYIAGTSVCTVSVAAGGAGIGTQYVITAIPRVGGLLDGSGVNLVTQNF